MKELTSKERLLRCIKGQETDRVAWSPYVNSMLTISKGKRYVLANSDSCPPGVAYEKFTTVTKWVREFNY